MQIKKIQRCDFLKYTGILTAGFIADRMPVMAGPFAPGESVVIGKGLFMKKVRFLKNHSR